MLDVRTRPDSSGRPAVIPVLYAGAMGVNGLTALVFGRLFDRYGI